MELFFIMVAKFKNTISTAVALMIFISGSASAQLFDKNYVSLAPLYSDLKVGSGSKEAGFNVSFGTEIHRQWYAEIGVNYFASGYVPLTQPADSASAFSSDAGIDASGVHLAFLGKAKGQQGELYYRLGIAALDVSTEQFVAADAACQAGTASSISAADGTAVSLCTVDDTQLAGMIGIGFDTYLGYETQLRFAIDHYRGEDDVQINTVQLGLRYNF
ncbi:MAG: hypothetical protein ACFHVJ_09855 [Aestuariibacter sp.]